MKVEQLVVKWDSDDIKPGLVVVKKSDGTRLTIVEQTSRGPFWGLLTEDWKVSVDFDTDTMIEHLNWYHFLPEDIYNVLAR